MLPEERRSRDEESRFPDRRTARFFGPQAGLRMTNALLWQCSGQQDWIAAPYANWTFTRWVEQEMHGS